LARQLNRIPECDRDALPSGAYTCASALAHFERAMERIDRAEGIVDGHKRKAIGHSNMRGYSGIRVAKSRTGAA
jgi:hypothetical protein